MSMADAEVPEPQEVTLADLIGILWRRRYVLMATFLLCVGGGIGYTLLQEPQYTASATIIAVDQHDILRRWLESREAAAWVGGQVGEPVAQALNAEPGSTDLAGAIARQSKVAFEPQVAGIIDRTMTISVELPDPGVARDIANSFIDSLEVIRPQLQNVTESALFAQFYDGQNAADARRQAHEVALAREYWIVIDPAIAPTSPSSPNVTLNIALSVVLGALLGVMAAFTWQWGSNYRASSRPPVLPPAPEQTQGFRYRPK